MKKLLPEDGLTFFWTLFNANALDAPCAISGNTFVTSGIDFDAIDVNIIKPLISFDDNCTFDTFKSIPFFISCILYFSILFICLCVNAIISFPL